MNLVFSKFLSSVYLGFEMLRLWIRGLFNDRPIRYTAFVALALHLGLWALAILLVQSIGNDLAVLHYNVVFGIDKVGEGILVYATPLLALLMLIINLIFSAFCLAKRERALALILLGVALLVQVFSLLALYFSYLANFS